MFLMFYKNSDLIKHSVFIQLIICFELTLRIYLNVKEKINKVKSLILCNNKNTYFSLDKN